METNNNRLIVVLGMHRSGTSAITRGLKVLGVNLGDTLYGALEGINDKGFWEDIHFNVLDVEMLASLGGDWHQLAVITQDDVQTLRNKGYFLRAVELLRQKVGVAANFGIKDPRIAKLLPFWKEVFSHCRLDVSYVLAVRHPLSVTKSLIKRDGFHAEKCYLLWLEHVLRSLKDSAGSRRTVIDFDMLMQSPGHELDRLAKQLDLTLDTEELHSYKTEFLDHSLRHTVYQLADLSLDVTCPPLVQEVYATLLDVASDRVHLEDPALQKKIELWVTELDRANAALMLSDKLDAQLAGLNQIVAERDVQLTGLNQTVAERDAQLTGLNQTVAERDAQLTGLNQIVAERDAQLAGLNQIVAERDAQLTGFGNTIEEIRASTSWRVTAPLRSVVTTLRKLRSIFAILPQIVQKGGGLWSTPYKAVRIFRKEGIPGVKARVRIVFRHSQRSAGTSHTSAYLEPALTPSKLPVVPYYIDPRLDSEAASPGKDVSIAVHLHLHYTEMLEEFASYLNNIPAPFDIFVSVPESANQKAIEAELKSRFSKVGRVVVEPVPNRGRDIAPMIVQFGKRLARYEIIAHIHTKKSPHSGDLSGWCQDVMSLLFAPPGSRGGHVAHIIGLLQTSAKIVFPESPAQILMDRTGWTDNYELARSFLEKHTQFSIDDFSSIEFPVGSMFWGRTDCLKELLELPISYNDFPPEPIAADGTLAHALERLILIFASKHEGQCIRLHNGDSIRDYRHYEEQQDYSATNTQDDIKVLSYYLPQFHPIPENDLWHGKDFTEWTKVRAANPLFAGHYQQHIPHSDIGYYLLDSPETLRQQAAMMHKAGVHGQVFYHYWFSGKLILEDPARMLLNTPDIRMPFCFCWANENWTRRWDGNESEILLAQNYSAQDAHDFIQYLIPFFKDPRHIRIDDRPVLFIYRPTSIPDTREYLDIWERECAKAGIKPPYVVAVLTRGATSPGAFGMDAGVERVLHDWTGGGAPEIKDTLHNYWPVNGSVLSYDDVVDFYMGQTEAKDFTYFRSLVPIWDNTARYGTEAYLLHGSTPQRFQEWMESTLEFTRSTLPADRRFVLVNAWNEWAEGAHLEPDSRYGYSYLNSIGRALSGIPYAADPNPDCAIPPGLRIHLSVPEHVVVQLRADPALKDRFIFGLARSGVFKSCAVSLDAVELLNEQGLAGRLVPADAAKIDFVLQFRRIAFFDPTVIEKMVQLACSSPGSVVLSNAYDRNVSLVDVTENGSVPSFAAHDAPLSLMPLKLAKSGFKNYRVRTDAHSFVTYPNTRNKKLPEVTTIIRFHKSANLGTLKNALYSLAAMQECVVVPCIAAQDLNEQQTAALQAALGDIKWAGTAKPVIHHYRSPNGDGDLRSRMLNETLGKVKTRYAAFLDYDDILMSHAYNWLLGRLEQTGKAVSFGRVYRMHYNTVTGRYMERKRAFEYGYTYDEFMNYNTAPLHSFMLDLKQLDLGRIVHFEDQRFMEDYFLLMQLVNRDNADWQGMAENVYIGDYIYSVDRAQTLAILDEQERQSLLSSPEYMVCEQRIYDMRSAIHLGATAKQGHAD